MRIRDYRLPAFVLAFSCIHGYVSAGLVDFESGFVDLQPVGVVATSDNVVTFAVGPNGGSPSGPGFIAAIGPPQTSFVPVDTPAGGVGGSFFLTDETSGPSAALDFFILFSTPVEVLGLSMYDYRADGGPSAGDVATLNGYSDAARTSLVGSASYTVTGAEPDGNVAGLSIGSPTSPIVAAHLTFTTPDVGVGIDNIRFKTVPEPTTFLVWSVLGIAGIGYVTVNRQRSGTRG